MAAIPALAQTTGSNTNSTSGAEESQWAFNLGLDVRVPTGDFSYTGGGLRMSLDRQLGRSVFSVGGEFVVLLYGEEQLPYSGEYHGRPLKSATTDHEGFNIAMLLRAQRPTGKWRPYADVVLGTHTFRTTTRVDGTGTSYCSFNGNCSTVGELTSTQLSDTVLTYGGGAGLLRTVTKGELLLLDFSIRYLRGGVAQYLTNGAIQRDGNTIVQIDVSRSRTDALAVYLGVRFANPFP